MKLRTKFRHAVWRIFGHPDYPPKFTVIRPPNLFTGGPSTNRIYDMAEAYMAGESIPSLAERYNVTRERIRQCLWKAYREALKHER